METLQNLLTIAAEATVIIGLAGIAVHAIYASHRNFMNEFCPAVKPYQAEVQAEEAPAVIAATEVKQPAEQPEAEAVTEVAPVIEEVLQAKKATTRKPRTKKAQPLAEELGLTPPSDWGKVQKAPAKTRTPRKLKTA